MLGCKYHVAKSLLCDFLGINRYMLGCKFTPVVQRLLLNPELIDTCWDVN